MNLEKTDTENMTKEVTSLQKNNEIEEKKYSKIKEENFLNQRLKSVN